MRSFPAQNSFLLKYKILRSESRYVQDMKLRYGLVESDCESYELIPSKNPLLGPISQRKRFQHTVLDQKLDPSRKRLHQTEYNFRSSMYKIYSKIILETRIKDMRSQEPANKSVRKIWKPDCLDYQVTRHVTIKNNCVQYTNLLNADYLQFEESRDLFATVAVLHAQAYIPVRYLPISKLPFDVSLQN